MVSSSDTDGVREKQHDHPCGWFDPVQSALQADAGDIYQQFVQIIRTVRLPNPVRLVKFCFPRIHTERREWAAAATETGSILASHFDTFAPNQVEPTRLHRTLRRVRYPPPPTPMV